MKEFSPLNSSEKEITIFKLPGYKFFKLIILSELEKDPNDFHLAFLRACRFAEEMSTPKISKFFKDKYPKKRLEDCLLGYEEGFKNLIFGEKKSDYKKKYPTPWIEHSLPREPDQED